MSPKSKTNKEKLREKLKQMRRARGGQSYRRVADKTNTSKKQKRKIKKKLHKEGLDAIMDQLGVDDATIRHTVKEAIRHGSIKNNQELTERISSLMAEKEAKSLEEEAKQMQSEAQETETEPPIPTLPGANRQLMKQLRGHFGTEPTTVLRPPKKRYTK